MSASPSDFDPASHTADVAIIGGGGAGLLAGVAAARAGARTVVYERMPTPGRKVAISGGGRCNFTNTLSARDFVRRFGDKNAAFLGHALRAFSSADLVALLAQHGVEGQLERDYRLYTKTGRGADVVKALVSELQKAGGVLVTGARIVSIQRADTGFVFEINFADHAEQRRARTVIICTGGMSYPATGSSGDGYTWARAFGHAVTALRAALVGLATAEAWPRALQGLAWPDAEVSLWPTAQAKGKPLCRERAEIVFTHFGISGPAVLDVSNVYVAVQREHAVLRIDFFPGLTRATLDQQLLARFKQFPNRGVARALDGLMPGRMLEHLESSLGPEAQVSVCRLPKAAREQLVQMLKQTTLTITGTRGIEHGEVTAGGVSWAQIEPTTLESRLCPGLFFAGEMLDVAGRCGGFNLQAAFSTGYLAGHSAAQRARQAAAEEAH